MAEASPISISKRYWKLTTDLKKRIIESVSEIVGGVKVATTIINAIEILYRKFLRKAMKMPGEDKVVDSLKRLAMDYITRIVAKGPTMFERNLRTETVVRVEVRDVPAGKKGVTKKEKEEVKYTGLIRPKISSDVCTSWESTLVGRINVQLTELVAEVPNFNSREADPSLKRWESNIKTIVDNAYELVGPFQKEITSRKKLLRANIMAAKGPAPTRPGMTAEERNQWAKISNAEWLNELNEATTTLGPEWENRFLSLFSLMAGRTLTKDEVSRMQANDIKALVRNKLFHL